jgi:hypothetical protein
MSRKNILKIEHKDDRTAHVTFQTHDGKERTYEYVGSSARAIKRGKTDPSQLVGREITK